MGGAGRAGAVVIDLSTMEYADLEFTLEDGYVTAVTLSDSAKQDGRTGWIYMSQSYYQVGHRRPGWGPAGVQLLQLRPGRLAGALGRAVGQL